MPNARWSPSAVAKPLRPLRRAVPGLRLVSAVGGVATLVLLGRLVLSKHSDRGRLLIGAGAALTLILSVAAAFFSMVADLMHERIVDGAAWGGDAAKLLDNDEN
jgi:hypothetical protein